MHAPCLALLRRCTRIAHSHLRVLTPSSSPETGAVLPGVGRVSPVRPLQTVQRLAVFSVLWTACGSAPEASSAGLTRVAEVETAWREAADTGWPAGGSDALRASAGGDDRMRASRRHAGLRVVGLDGDRLPAGLRVDTVPGLLRVEAEELVQRECVPGARVVSSQLVVRVVEEGAGLAWEVEVAGPPGDSAPPERLYVDARSGDIAGDRCRSERAAVAEPPSSPSLPEPGPPSTRDHHHGRAHRWLCSCASVRG